MYKVLIVDDEKEIREGLKAIFPWTELGVNEIFTAEDGETALISVNRLNPDLIVTDIKMDRMSGLEFIRELHESGNFSGKTVVVSGYDDFELVKQAMKLGAIDYILKPINTEELKQVIIKAIDQIRKERILEQNKLFLENQVHQAIPQMSEEVLRELTEKEYNPYWETRIMYSLKNLKLDWLLHDEMVLLIVEVDDLKAIEQRKQYKREKELILFAIGNVMKQTLEEEYRRPSELYKDKQERWVILLSYEKSDKFEIYKSLARLLIVRVNEYVKVNVTIGFSPSIGGLNKLFTLYQEAREALKQKVVYGGNQLLVANDMWEAPEFSEVTLCNINEAFDLVKYGSEHEIREAMGAFQELVRTWSLSHIRDIQGRTFDWLFELFKKAAAAGWKERWWEKNLISIWEKLEQYDTLESLQKQTLSYMLDMANSLKNQMIPLSQIITEAEKYMKIYYMDNLTLQIVADQVHVTPIWLSKLFKKETQTTFLEYLTEIRMEKAKEMLNDVKFRIYQISQKTGYRNPEHFTKLFKKIVGCTPKEYRNQRGIQDE